MKNYKIIRVYLETYEYLRNESRRKRRPMIIIVDDIAMEAKRRQIKKEKINVDKV